MKKEIDLKPQIKKGIDKAINEVISRYCRHLDLRISVVYLIFHEEIKAIHEAVEKSSFTLEISNDKKS